jgi:hypothetical protein
MKNNSKILEISDKIRGSLHDSTIVKTKVFQKREKGFWDQLWTCLDTINHTEIAILEFKVLKEVDFAKVPNTLTYGLLQNLYVQQDALSNLSESILNKRIDDWSRNYPSLFYVRDIRNITIGHPTKEGRKGRDNKYCVIDQGSLTKNGFSFWIWSRSGFKKQYIEFSELIKKQNETLLNVLTKIYRRIKKKEVEHKKKFKGQSLSLLLPQGEPYSLSILSRLAHDQLGWIALQDYKKNYEEIKKGIEERYGELSQSLRIPGTKLLIEELDTIFKRIEEMKNVGPDMEIDLGIYADALIDRLKELKTHLDEIDEEFATK